MPTLGWAGSPIIRLPRALGEFFYKVCRCLPKFAEVSRFVPYHLRMACSDTHHTLRDHDGFIETLYHLLWVKNINGEPCPNILVPDVVIYKYRSLACRLVTTVGRPPLVALCDRACSFHWAPHARDQV